MFKFQDDRGVQLAIILIVFFVFDAFNVLLFKTRLLNLDVELLNFVRFSALPKGFVFLLLLINSVRERKSYERLGFFLVFLIIAYSNLKYNSVSSLFVWLVFSAKYLFSIVLYHYFKEIDWKGLSLARNIFLGIITIQVVSVLIGFIFEVKALASYGLNRFGFSGLIFAVNEITFFYSISSIYLFYLWQKENKCIYFLILLGVICAGILMGAKAYFLSFSILSFFLLINLYKKVGLLRTFLCLILLVIPIFLVLKFSSLLDFHLQLMRENGILSALSSLRSDLVILRLPELYSDWSMCNFLFGGMNPQQHMVEMDLIDLFSIGGIVGFVTYLFVMFRTVFQRNANVYLYVLFWNWLIIGALAGHVFNSGVNALYLVFVSISILKDNNRDKARM